MPAPAASIFKTRQSTGEFLSHLFAGVKHKALHDTAMWSWLSMFLLTDLVPSASALPKYNLSLLLAHKGERSPGWAQEPRAWARHWLWTSWRLYEQHGPRNSISALMGRDMRQWSAFEYRMFGSQKWFASRGVMAAAARLYLQSDSTLIRGSGSEHALGGLQHLLRVLPQLELIYDLYDMDGETVLRLLPKPFQDWLEKRALLQ